MRAALSLLASALGVATIGPVGWPTGMVNHAFFNTDHGQLHYVISHPKPLYEEPYFMTHKGGVPPVVFFHSHPRSTVEFKYIAQNLDGIPFIAIDWFGMGMSDDYAAGPDSEFCTFEQMAGIVLQLLHKEGVEEFVASGSLKGAHPAIELAAQSMKRGWLPGPWTKKLVLINPLILDPKALAYINNVFIPKARNLTFASNGSHLLDGWNDPSAGPQGSDMRLHTNDDIRMNEEKTTDLLRQMGTGWQYQMGWTAYNDKNEPRLAAFSAFPNTETVVVMGKSSFDDEVKYGLDPQFSVDAIDRALNASRKFPTKWVDGAGQGMAMQNATLLGGLIHDFVLGSQAAVIV